MGRFHEILEEEHIKFTESLDGQQFFNMLSEMEQLNDKSLIEKPFLQNLIYIYNK